MRQSSMGAGVMVPAIGNVRQSFPEHISTSPPIDRKR